jgi:oligoendopeptidase F
MGHAFHGELCQKQGTIYSSYSTSLAESASTLFETLAVEEVSETLSDKEKIIALHDRINDDIQTIFRQIACFNFEKDLHQAIRSKGYLTKEEIGWFHNKNMKAYLGPLYQFTENDGYFFVTWSHIRRFFYVYSYAYGQLVSKALVRRYRQDKKFWSKIEQYLSAGGKDSPENILKEIGLDVTKPEFWKEGLKELEENIIKLEKLVAKKK